MLKPETRMLKLMHPSTNLLQLACQAECGAVGGGLEGHGCQHLARTQGVLVLSAASGFKSDGNGGHRACAHAHP